MYYIISHLLLGGEEATRTGTYEAVDEGSCKCQNANFSKTLKVLHVLLTSNSATSHMISFILVSKDS